MRRFLVGLIRAYQVALSPLLGPRCRFYPTCSEYAREGIERHGPLAGIGLGVLRLLRCHPLSRGGVDPCPETLPWQMQPRAHNPLNEPQADNGCAQTTPVAQDQVVAN